MQQKKLFQLNSPIKNLFKIDLPIIQGGMVWVSGSKLAAACSNQGALGLIGAGSMNLETLKVHLTKIKNLTNKPYGINIPLLYRDSEKQIALALENNVKIFFTSAGNPKTYTSFLKSHGAIVVHVTSNPDLAQKCVDAGVDAVVLEGFEAGGHNGRDELTTLTLLAQIQNRLPIPVIAAGGITHGSQILAALSLGADAVQMGTRFVASFESSAHQNFKNRIISDKFNETMLMLKKQVPVRLLKNDFSERISLAESKGASKEELELILGKGRARKGMFEGDLIEGELEIGQSHGLVKKVLSVEDIFKDIHQEFESAYNALSNRLNN